MRKPTSSVAGAASHSTASTRASGGASVRTRRTSSSSTSAGPSISAKTPSVSLPTNPATRASVASRYTNGRKPTPCTTPRTRSRRRSRVRPASTGWPSVVTDTRSGAVQEVAGHGFERVHPAGHARRRTSRRAVGALLALELPTGLPLPERELVPLRVDALADELGALRRRVHRSTPLLALACVRHGSPSLGAVGT